MDFFKILVIKQYMSVFVSRSQWNSFTIPDISLHNILFELKELIIAIWNTSFMFDSFSIRYLASWCR